MFRQFLKRRQQRLGSQLKTNMIAIGMVFALFTIGCHYYVDVHFEDSYAKVRQLNALSSDVDALKESLIDQETGQRGYALTGEMSYLEPYVTGTSTFEEKTASLQKGLESFPELRDSVQEMIARGHLWHNLYGEPLVQTRRQGDTLTKEEFAFGKEAFDSFREAARDATTRIEESKNVISADLENDVDRIWTVVAILSGTVGLFAMLLVSGMMQKIVQQIVALERVVRAYKDRNFDVPVPETDQDNELSSLIRGVDVMRRELKEGFLQTKRLAEIDGLTGVGNRRMYDLALEDAVQSAEHGGGEFALVLLDIDRFKSFNDTYGHLEGDAVLRHVAGVLTSRLGADDLLARYGGEEFAVLLRGEGQDPLAQVERLRLAVEGEGMKSYVITASFGVAVYHPGDTPVSLFQKADHALYQAKANGRNRIEFAD